MALLSAYFDESGTDGQRGVTVLGGYVGTDTRWTPLEREWARVLGVYEIKVFHLVEALEGTGEFQKLGSKRHDLIVKLSELIRDSGVNALFSGVIDVDWYEVVTDEEFLARFPKPLDLCFEDIVLQMREIGRQNPEHDRPALVFAHQPEYHKRMAEIARVYAQSAWHNEYLGSITFDTTEHLIPLQAADFVSHELRFDLERREYVEHKMLSDFRTRVILDNATSSRAPWGHYFDKRGLLLTMERFKKTGKIW